MSQKISGMLMRPDSFGDYSQTNQCDLKAKRVVAESYPKRG